MDTTFPGFEPFMIPNLPPAAYYIPDIITPEEEELLLRKIEETPQPKWKTVGTGRRLAYWGGTLSGKGVLLPEEMPPWLTEFPDIVRRIDTSLDAAADTLGADGHALGINQVLVNEYKPGQGISPHEDGGAFRPLVATLSLGSHTVLDLYHYVSPTAPSPPMINTEETEGGGKVVAAVPLGHVLLLPRSLFVITRSLYESHLHGIAERAADRVVAGAGDGECAEQAQAQGPPPVVVANAALLKRPDIQAAIESTGWTAERETRVSLTFRRANKVLKGGAFALVGGKLRRG